MKRAFRLASFAAFALFLIAGAWFFTSPALHAQVGEGLNAVAPTIRLSSSDPRVIAARIINVALGLLGIIFLALVVYAGFLWMTSGGDAGNAEKARTLLRNAVIGLIIILSSWAITRYVLTRLLEATNPSGGGAIQDGGSAGGGGFGAGGGTFSGFQVSSISPTGDVPWRNVRVRFIFNDQVDPASASSYVKVYRVADNAPVDGTVTVLGSVVEFVPTAPCPAAVSERCFEENTQFRASVTRDMRSLARGGVASQRLVCGGLAPACEAIFKTGNQVDNSAPNVTITAPYYGQSVSQNDSVIIATRAVDNFAVSYVSSSVGGADIGVASPTSTQPVFAASIPWSTRGVATGTYALRSSAHDGDSNRALSGEVMVAVRPEHCFNGRQDEDEAGLDCGGDACGHCAGAVCRDSLECNGLCERGVCVERPVILGVSPNNGKAGSIVTISGANFGSRPGQVRFWDGAGFGAVASAPVVCASGTTWSATQIIVEVPPSARTGAIQVTNASSSLSDATNDTNGPILDGFTVNGVSRPGLCGIAPVSGERGDVVTLSGVALGSTPGRVFFGERDVTPASFVLPWSSTRVAMNTPVITAGRYPVRVRVGTEESNSVSFLVTERVRANPVIDSLDPVRGPIGEYITLVGRNFGTTIGQVVFVNTRTGEQGAADTTFPEACARDFWHDTTVTVKVPPTIALRSAVTPDVYRVYVRRQADGVESNRSEFTVNSAIPRPGICSVAPVGGPVGTVVTLTGERFGSRADNLSFQGSFPEARVTAAAISRWTDSAITATVPSGAFTGPVRVTLGSASSSNGVNFAVRNCTEDALMCGAETCCRDSGQCSVRGVCAAVAASSMYGWELSTGQLPLYPEVVEECSGRAGLPPSPSPWNGRVGGDNACVNAEVVIRFNTLMNRATLTSSNVIVSRCTASGVNPCATKVPVSGRFEINDSDGGLTARRTMVTFSPAPSSPGGEEVWTASSTYDISLTTRVASQDGVTMRASTRCGAGMGYCFQFSTASSTVPCRVGSAGVTPSPFTARDLGEQVAYRGNALSAQDQCIQINPATLSWSWYTGRTAIAPDSRASLSNYSGTDCVSVPGRTAVAGTGGVLTHCPWRQTATAQNETGPTLPVLVNAQAVAASDVPVVGTAPLYIQFIPPQVVSYGPNCNEACTESKLWAEFNVPMDPIFATTRQVLLYKCANENCRTFSPSTPLVLSSRSVNLVNSRTVTGVSGRARRLEIDPVNGLGASYLEPGAFYKLILKGDADPTGREGLRSLTGLRLTELNDRQGFAWRFRVRQDNRGVCDVTRVDVIPLEKVETVVGARELFTAEPVSISQACGEQYLMSRGSYVWNSEFVDVSKFINARGDGLIDTNATLPANCSGRCTNMGSEGVDGRIASCGNTTVETTDGTSCRRRAASPTCTPPEPGCVCTPADTDCVLRADASQSCKVLPPGSQAGEECDLGSADRGGLNGVAGSLCTSSCLWAGVTGGTCGDGRLNAGEQCDPGKACVGGDRVGALCLRDDNCTGGGRCVVNLVGTGCSDRCLALGSGSVTTPGEDSQCGNGSVGAGETCDDGNLTAGDGCSLECLHEGSRAVVAICGNGGSPEPGESCERRSDGSWPTGCNRETCLNEGTSACPVSGGPTIPRLNCCGNGATEAGEDCDDSNGRAGDGCSARCLAEGSSIGYFPNPSICGDRLRTVGEQCEATRSDELTNARQISQIVGEREPDTQGLMMSRVRATYATKTGEARHGLQCGFTAERECVGDPSLGRTIESNGLTVNGCCMARPQVTRVRYPLPDAENVCRNTSIYLSFNQLMEEASLRDNILIGEVIASGACPAGTQTATPISVYPRVCLGRVTGSMHFERDGAGTRAVFALDRALAATTTYRLIVRGDLDLMDATKTGVRNTRGVVMAGDASWTFTTGNRICTANEIVIRDTNADHPFLFQRQGEAHDFSAMIMSSQDGVLRPISSVAEYGWRWHPWLSSETRVLTVGATVTDRPQQSSTSTIQAQNRAGSSLIFAGIRIDRDSVNVPSASGTTLEAARVATVSLCQRSWPSSDTRYTGALLFSDSRPRTGEPSVLTGTIFENGPYYNFGTNYCLDEGDSATSTDDLPALTIRPTPPSSSDVSRGLLRQYLLTLDSTNVPVALRKDAIGIRVFDNPLHLSARAWYTAQGFTGSPTSLSVDGYEAIRDGATVYVSAPNLQDSTRGPVTSTIYLISHNPDAQPQTQDIFDQLLRNWVFNVNIQQDSANVCKTETGAVYLDRQRVVSCSSDWECAAYGDSLRCASFKAKIQRDGQRLADFQTYMTKLEAARARDGRYPTIVDGSYLQGITNSRWGSWQAVLGQALGGPLPIDPVNRFLTCGRCRYAGVTTPGEPCMDASDCRAGGSCAGIPRASGAVASYDPSTCWEVSSRRFMCPRLASGPSRFYQYRSIGNGVGYELGTELEAASYDRYQPPLISGMRRCSNTGQLCQTDAQCITYYAGTARESSRGTCQATGGQWRYENVCTGREFGIDAVCGNGIRSAGEACEVGDTATASCVAADGRPGMKQQICAPTCQSFIDGPTTRCVPLGLCGNGRVDRYLCEGAGVKYGQGCSAATVEGSAECADQRDPAGTVMRCVSISSIPRAGAEEVCDEGVLNGTYGHCNRTCTGFDATCGDGELSPGETCDNGASNGQYCDTRASEPGREMCRVAQSCGFDCRSRAPFCGDGAVQAGDGEQCEPGQTEVTTSSICSSGPFAGIKACSADADCTVVGVASGRCGSGADDFGGVAAVPAWDDCRNISVSRCIGTGSICQLGDHRRCSTDADCAVPAAGGRCVSRFELTCTTDAGCGPGGRCNAYPTQRTRSCSTSEDDGAPQCTWRPWSACQPAATCGDGIRDTGEDCDDGNSSDNDSCTSLCRANVCGDGYLQTGAEQCDYGDPARGGRNGAACTSEYGLTCAVCTTSCRVEAQSGGFCGNGRRDGREQCDFVGACVGGTSAGARCTIDAACEGGGRCAFDGVAPGTSCRAIGFDYANNATCNTYPYMTNPDGSIACINTTGVTSDCQTCSLGADHPSGYSVGVRIGGGDCRACPGGNCVGRGAQSNQRVTIANQSACIPGTIADALSCSTSCGYAGCGSCLGTPSAENAATLRGEVFDRDAGEPIPGARVVITYRGNPVVDTVTDSAGRFTAPNLHGRRECGQYRIVISSERDNPLTLETVENLGYRPFEFGVFSPIDFASRVGGTRIELTPRTGEADVMSSGGLLPRETRVLVTWNGQLPLLTIPGRTGQRVRSIFPHLIVPASRSYVKVPARFGSSLRCSVDSFRNCSVVDVFSSPPRITCAVRDGGLMYCSVPTGVGGTGVQCAPDGDRGRDAVARALVGARIDPADYVISQYQAVASCPGSLTAGSDGILLGFATSTACSVSSRACSADESGTPCCSRDIGSGMTWQGYPSISFSPAAVASCKGHKITTDAHCEALRAGTVPGIIAAAQGPRGVLTSLACTNNNSCDEYVREANPSTPMMVKYIRSSQTGDVYQFYLEQTPYAEREMTAGEGGVAGRVLYRCYAPRGVSFTPGGCSSGLERVVECGVSGCTEVSVPAGSVPIVCADGGDTCSNLGTAASEVQIVRIGGGGASFRSTLSSPAHFMNAEIGLRVQVLSGADVVTITPPAESGITCTSGNPYLWLAFEQDAATGRITVPNSGSGRFVCDPPAGMSGVRSSVANTTYSILDAPVAQFPLPPLDN
jgi:cysteine-rich repeat protein